MITACKSCILRGLECQYSDLKVSCDACHEGGLIKFLNTILVFFESHVSPIILMGI